MNMMNTVEMHFFNGVTQINRSSLSFSVIVQWKEARLDVVLEPVYINQRFAEPLNQKFVILVVVKIGIS